MKERVRPTMFKKEGPTFISTQSTSISVWLLLFISFTSLIYSVPLSTDIEIEMEMQLKTDLEKNMNLQVNGLLIH